VCGTNSFEWPCAVTTLTAPPRCIAPQHATPVLWGDHPTLLVHAGSLQSEAPHTASLALCIACLQVVSVPLGIDADGGGYYWQRAEVVWDMDGHNVQDPARPPHSPQRLTKMMQVLHLALARLSHQGDPLVVSADEWAGLGLQLLRPSPMRTSADILKAMLAMHDGIRPQALNWSQCHARRQTERSSSSFEERTSRTPWTAQRWREEIMSHKGDFLAYFLELLVMALSKVKDMSPELSAMSWQLASMDNSMDSPNGFSRDGQHVHVGEYFAPQFQARLFRAGTLLQALVNGDLDQHMESLPSTTATILQDIRVLICIIQHHFPDAEQARISQPSPLLLLCLVPSGIPWRAGGGLNHKLLCIPWRHVLWQHPVAACSGGIL
jgi:hypothetical protein